MSGNSRNQCGDSRQSRETLCRGRALCVDDGAAAAAADTAEEIEMGDNGEFIVEQER